MTDARASTTDPAARWGWRLLAVFLAGFAGLVAFPGLVGGPYRAGYVLKFGVALAALVAVLAEGRLRRRGRILPRRLRVGATLVLAVCALVSYFQAMSYAYPRVFHVWEQYHYYLGAKYFRELGYDGLYRCTLVAQDQRGGTAKGEEGDVGPRVDVRAETRDPARRIRDLDTYRIVPAADALADPAWCTRRFTPARWAAFTDDVVFLRDAAWPQHWNAMLRDHGFNPPPGWLLMAKPLAELGPASDAMLLGLASLDVLLLAAAFGAMAWAFGWRVTALAVVFWGTQPFAPYGWTGGAFLRQDWLFFLVLSLCLARRRWYALSGAALVASAMLRVFPLLFAAGWAVGAVHGLVRHRRIPRPHLRALAGAAAAALVLLPASMAVAGPGAYDGFARHTLALHGSTPLSNHMGGRTLLTYVAGLPNPASRLRNSLDLKAENPHAVWSRTRRENDARVRPLVYVAGAAALLALWAVARRRPPWVALSLSTLVVVAATQLTCYYYIFLLLLPPLARRRWAVAPMLLGLAVVADLLYVLVRFNDDRFAVMSVLVIAATGAISWLVARPPAGAAPPPTRLPTAQAATAEVG